MDMKKYPRTPHLEGSRLQAGDSAADIAALADLAGRHVVIEEKFDGANAGVWFDGAGRLQLQSRGHMLDFGRGVRRAFKALQPWALARAERLLGALEDRYVMYGEWMAAKHGIYYDALPDWFLEFDLFDRASGTFLSTARRRALLEGLPVVPVAVLYEGPMPDTPARLGSLVRRSLAKSAQWRASFEAEVERQGLPLTRTWQQTDPSDDAEGLYVKVEDDERVLARYKFVRRSFQQMIDDGGDHHMFRPMLPNRLADGGGAGMASAWGATRGRTLRTFEELDALRQGPASVRSRRERRVARQGKVNGGRHDVA